MTSTKSAISRCSNFTYEAKPHQSRGPELEGSRAGKSLSVRVMNDNFNYDAKIFTHRITDLSKIYSNYSNIKINGYIKPT